MTFKNFFWRIDKKNFAPDILHVDTVKSISNSSWRSVFAFLTIITVFWWLFYKLSHVHFYVLMQTSVSKQCVK